MPVDVTTIRRLGQRIGQELHAGVSRGGVPRSLIASATRPDVRVLGALERRVERMVAEDVLPFWTRDTWDEPEGGFITHLDRGGGRLGPGDKGLVSQARMIWTLAAAHRHGLADRGYLALAARGLRFLTERMWDRSHEGLVLLVRRDGHVLDGRKDVCAHAYALQAFSEYALATGDRWALGWAEALFDLLERRAGDGAGGYASWFERDWTPAAGPSLTGPSVGSHVHLMTAFALLAEASTRPSPREALARIVDLLLAHAVHPRWGCAMEGFDRTRRPGWLSHGRQITSYGHSAELAWLLLDALDRLGRSREGQRPTILGLIDHVLEHGFDWRRGGVALYGPPRGHVTRAVYLAPRRLRKVWWPQAELLVALVEAYRWSGELRYWAAFERQIDWISRYQSDPEGGDWFETVSWRGRPLTLVKGHASKEPYHHGRALMRTARALRALAATPADGGS
jgi:mannobiose 2-epimerase